MSTKLELKSATEAMAWATIYAAMLASSHTPDACAAAADKAIEALRERFDGDVP
jgi:hypothetical protein